MVNLQNRHFKGGFYCPTVAKVKSLMLFYFLLSANIPFYLEFSKHDISFTADDFLQCLILKESLLFDCDPFNNNYGYMQGGFKCLSLYYITFPFI